MLNATIGVYCLLPLGVAVNFAFMSDATQIQATHTPPRLEARKEQSMAEDNPSQTVEDDSLDAQLLALGLSDTEGEEVATEPGTDEIQQDSSAKGILREAIQKVMKEISYHEREAEKHMQQAKALRKDLRDSFAFLQERQDDVSVPTGASTKSRPSGGVEHETVGKAKDAVPATKAPRGNPKKKHVAKKD
jgi:hypothetical protein